MYKKILPFVVLLFLGACSFFPQQSSQPTGILQGNVSIGPLQPVQRVGVTPPPPPPEVYTSRGINIYKPDGVTLVKSLHFNPDGTYQAALTPGQYVIKLIPSGIDHSKDLPANIIIQSGETVKLDIDIDTGNR